MSHHCHADGCAVEVPPKMFMCLRHWKMVPRFAQQDIWKHYRARQEIDKRPSREYIKATQRARLIVNMKEKGYTLEDILTELEKIQNAFR